MWSNYSKFHLIPVLIVIIKPNVNDPLIDTFAIFRVEDFIISANTVANFSCYEHTFFRVPSINQRLSRSALITLERGN